MDTIAEAAAAVADEALEDSVKGDGAMATDEATALLGLTENVRDQDDLERDITNQANMVMIEQEDERD
jgi:DNA excision repair protein ERCC-6